ncbi:MAG: mechanosensitive ion channel domain-containing protein [Candidatus Methanofastidiosia archaeon]
MALNLESFYPIIYSLGIFVSIIISTHIGLKILDIIIKRTIGVTNPILATAIQRYVFWIVWIVAILFAISQIEFTIDILLAIILLIGFGFVLAGKGILENILSRFFLDLNPQYKIGDWIRVKNYYGRVVQINTFYTTLLTESGEAIHVPNMLFSKEIVVNISSGAGVEVMVPISVAKDRDLVKTERDLKEIALRMKEYLRSGLEPRITISKLSQQGAEIQIFLRIKRPEDRQTVLSEINKKIKNYLET